MEIEMKALCRSDQIYKLFENKLNNFTKVGTNIDKLLFKSDRYYSWGGEQLLNPKKIYRVRTEAEIAKLVDEGKIEALNHDELDGLSEKILKM